MTSEVWWAVDVEGNGGNPPEMVELAVVELSGQKMTGRRFHWRLKPSQPIHPAATKIHGITNEDVSDAPSADDISDAILTWLADAPIVGHNVKVDLDVMQRAFPDWSPRRAIDTLRLARLARPGLESYALKNLASAYGLNAEAERVCEGGHHSAPYDAMLAALLLERLTGELPPAERDVVLRRADILFDEQPSLI